MGVSEEPQIGDTLQVNAYVGLHNLSPERRVRGGRLRPGEENDELANVTFVELEPKDELGSGRYLFTGSIVIDRSGSFGYTVRVLPKHEALASKAELGLIVNA